MVLKKGTVSKDVAEWQKFLGLPADGIFGENTEKATKNFQKNYGLDADGIVGPGTLKKAAEVGFKSIPIAPAISAWYPPKPNFGSPTNAQREQLFGTFAWKRKNSTDIVITDGWAQENIVWVTIPQLAGVHGAPKDGKILFHKKGAENIKGFFAEIERQGLLDLVISWAGSFYPRFIRGSQSALSNHSWGTAFDINAPENWLGATPAPVGKKGSLLKLVPIANSFGFYWGGHYNSRLDGMHFELAVPEMRPKPVIRISSVAENIDLTKIQQALAALPNNPQIPAKEQGGIPPELPSEESPNDFTEGERPPTQQAENITNVNSGNSLPPNFKPENIAVAAPPPSGMLKKGWVWLAGLGILPTSFGGLVEGLRGLTADGNLNWNDIFAASKAIFVFVLPYIFWVAVAFVVFWGIKELLKQISFIVTLYTNARGDMNNVQAVPAPAEPGAWRFAKLPFLPAKPPSVTESE